MLISLLLLFFSCKNEPEIIQKAKNNELIFCEIITSSTGQQHKLIDTTLWISSDISKDDILIFKFHEKIYIQKIVLEQPADKNFSKITQVQLYTDKGKKGCHKTDNIIVNDSIFLVIIKFSDISDFNLTCAYKDTDKFQIAFENLNNSVEIKQVSFWKNDSTEFKAVSYKKRLNETKSLIDLYDKKIIDYSETQKSIIVNSNGEFVGCIDDTIFYGSFIPEIITKKSNSYAVKFDKFVFYDNNYEITSFESKLKIVDNKLIIEGLTDFMFDFKPDYFVDIKTLDTTIVHDIRYATENNFVGKQIYDCPFCLLRYEVAIALVKAQQEFLKMGYSIKVFDCYRPLSAQVKLWEVLPNINYVANPEKGSIHNRGGAVDLTLVDSFGNELDMGTEFDFFGYKAYSINLDLPDTILNNRRLMWDIMNKNGFMNIKTEWWHMSHYSCLKYEISDVKFPCEDKNTQK